MMMPGSCQRRNCDLINGSVQFYTISYNVAVVADTLYHAKVAVEADMGIVP
jgi:hypothetical protein